MNTLYAHSNIVPENVKGKSSDIEHSVSATNFEEARDIYKRASKRMLNLNIWKNLGGFPSAEFTLTDKNGQKLERLAAQGDYIKIDILGPGPAAGDGFDWVYIEALEDNSNADNAEESIGMRVRPCQQPGSETHDVAHFFTGDATSTFIICRKQNTVHSFYHGRNEVLNNNTDNVLDKIRNAIMGGVALAGVSEIQWTNLIKSFLEREV